MNALNPWLILVSLIAAAAPALAKETVYVAPLQSTSVAEDLRVSATELLVIYLRDRGLEVHTPADGARPASPDTAAKAAGASHVVDGRMTRVGRKAIVFIEMRRVGETSAGWTGRMTANNPEDLEAVMTRMARGVDTGEAVKDTLDVHTVTQAEERRLRRKKANHYFGVSLGGMSQFGLEQDFMSGVGLFWLYDVRTMMFELDFHTYFADGPEHRTGVSISGYYPFSEDDITPYLGGGLEYGGTTKKGDKDRDGERDYDYDYYDDTVDGQGLSAFLGGGVLLGRTNTVAVRVDARYMVSFYDVADEIPHGLAFSIGLGF